MLRSRVSLLFGVERLNKLVLNIRNSRHIRLVYGNRGHILNPRLILDTSLVQLCHKTCGKPVVLLRQVSNIVIVTEFRILYALVFGLAEGVVIADNGFFKFFVKLLCNGESVLCVISRLRLIGRH